MNFKKRKIEPLGADHFDLNNLKENKFDPQPLFQKSTQNQPYLALT
jgi:hypothetical protein